jgi:hypothetical protein
MVSDRGDRRLPLQVPGLGIASIPAIVARFKASATRKIAELGPIVPPIWQRDGHEHIVRADRSLDAIRAYIASNPSNWYQDCENPQAVAVLKKAEPWQI